MVLAACAGTSPTRELSPAESRGGTLDVRNMPTRPIRVEGEHLEVWGMSEVPANSRLPASYALNDAVVRTELAQFIRSEIVSQDLLVLDRQIL